VVVWLVALVLYWCVAPTRESPRHTLASIILSYLVLWGVIFLWSDVPKKRTAQRFLLATGSLACTVGFLELLVLATVVDFRVAFGTPVLEPWAHHGNLLDPRLLHIHKPHDVWPWYGIDYRYDQHGLRNESDLEAADVVVIGDSFVEGMGVSATDLLTTHLAKQLDCTVANVSQAWYGPQQELELLRRYGLQLRPKTCVWAFFDGNDLDDVHRYKEATKDWGTFSKGFHSFTQRSFTKNALLATRRLLDAAQHSAPAQGAHNTEMERSGIFNIPSKDSVRLYFWYRGLHLSTKDDAALEELRSILCQAHELCRAQETRFLVVFVPAKHRVYGGLTEFDADALPRYWVINELPKRLESLVREDLPDAGFLDLTPSFSEEAKRGSLLYFPYDSHWSPEGHRVAANAIGRFLTRWE